MLGNNVTQINSLQGIIKALEEYGKRLHEHKVIIHVRRGGPNYQEGLRKMKETGLFHRFSCHLCFILVFLSNDFKIYRNILIFIGSRLNLPIHVYGPETHMTSIVAAALGLCRTPDSPLAVQTTGQFLLPLEADVSMDNNGDAFRS